MEVRKLSRVIGGKRYNTETATVIASNCYWDGNNWERHGRNTFLLKTQKGNYFAVYQTCWQGERDNLQPLSRDEAMEMYEELPEHEVEYEVAFPGVVAEEA